MIEHFGVVPGGKVMLAGFNPPANTSNFIFDVIFAAFNGIKVVTGGIEEDVVVIVGDIGITNGGDGEIVILLAFITFTNFTKLFKLFCKSVIRFF